MRIIGILPAYVVSLFQISTALPLVQERDAPFGSRLDRDFSKLKGLQPDKYFRESRLASHYDGRFADRELAYEERRMRLKALTQTYLSTMDDIGIETFLVHGTLLGWWWNRRIMPWDDDMDVMVSETSIRHLASYYNMTMHHVDYLLDINPHYLYVSEDKLNMIDARWIDTNTSLYIDITTLRTNQTALSLGMRGVMMVKDKHHYRYDDIFPLRESSFEGFPVKVPFAYTELLIEEYGVHALTNIHFHNHHFDAEKQDWVPLSCEDFRTCDYYRNPTDGIHLPNAHSNRIQHQPKANEPIRVPKLPLDRDVRPPPPRPLDKQSSEETAD